MPIEIKELIIKATVQDQPDAGASPRPAADETARAALVAECVERVLERLRAKQER